MRKWWYRLKSRLTPNRDQWQYQYQYPYPYQYHNRAKQRDYGWIRRTITALLIFTIVYGLYISDTTVGRSVGGGVRYVLTTEPDINYLVDWITTRVPKNLDMSALKKVRATISKPADPLMYMAKPVNGTLLSPYGWQTHPVSKQQIMNEGIDIETSLGTGVSAAAPGTVKAVSDTAQTGRIVIIEHSHDVETIYGRLGEVLVKPGDLVSQGQIIARVGKTSPAAIPSLYFEVRVNGKAVDPLTRVKGEFPLKERE